MTVTLVSNIDPVKNHLQDTFGKNIRMESLNDINICYINETEKMTWNFNWIINNWYLSFTSGHTRNFVYSKTLGELVVHIENIIRITRASDQYRKIPVAPKVSLKLVDEIRRDFKDTSCYYYPGTHKFSNDPYPKALANSVDLKSKLLRLWDILPLIKVKGFGWDDFEISGPGSSSRSALCEKIKEQSLSELEDKRFRFIWRKK
jgi:hypothetical protein